MTTVAYQPLAPSASSLVLPLAEAGSIELVGGKAHNLHRMMALGLRVPDGFVLTTRALYGHLEAFGLEESSDSRRIAEAIMNAPLPASTAELVRSLAV